MEGSGDPKLAEIPLPQPGPGNEQWNRTKPKPTKTAPIKLIRTKLEQLKRKAAVASLENHEDQKPDKKTIKIEPVSVVTSDITDVKDENASFSSSVAEEMLDFLKSKFDMIERERVSVADGDRKQTMAAADGVVDGAADGDKKSTGGKLTFGLKISETSAALISSGVPIPKEKVHNAEEGELTDSIAESESSGDIYGDLDEKSETGSITDGSTKAKKKKKKKHKHKSKKKKKAKEKDSEKRRSGSKDRSKSREKSKDSKKRSKRSRSKSPSKHRRRSSRSLSPSEAFFDKHRGISKKRSKSRSPAKKHSSEAERFWGRDYDRVRRRSRSRERDKGKSRDDDRYGDRLRSRRSRSRERIDKDRLRAIAVAKAYANMRAGLGPNVNLKPDEVASLRAGGRSIDELTQVCQKISETQGAISSSEESDINKAAGSDEEEAPFMNHPFKVNQSSNIVMNIRNAKQLPVLTPHEKIAQSGKLRMEFPVSSGSHHRAKEWVPVEKPSTATTTSGNPSIPDSPQSIPTNDKVFPDQPAGPVDIGAIVSERLKAVRKLQENPNDVQAMTQMYSVQQKMNQWANSKNLPGQFVGSTGVQILSAQELSGTHPKNQAWFKKDQFQKAAPVKGGVGMFLLQKMGWKEGQGLGKNSEGPAEPLVLDFKVDRKGLTTEGEGGKKATLPAVKVARDMSGKHPVSALVEICNRRHWGSPDFILVHESGPDHKKNFLFKVKVNNTEYQPSIASGNKKLAKAQAATVCLQALGMLPR